MNALDFVDILFINFSNFNSFVFNFWAIFGLVLLILETLTNGITEVSDPLDAVVCVAPPATSSNWVQAQLEEFEEYLSWEEVEEFGLYLQAMSRAEEPVIGPYLSWEEVEEFGLFLEEEIARFWAFPVVVEEDEWEFALLWAA